MMFNLRTVSCDGGGGKGTGKAGQMKSTTGKMGGKAIGTSKPKKASGGMKSTTKGTGAKGMKKSK